MEHPQHLSSISQSSSSSSHNSQQSDHSTSSAPQQSSPTTHHSWNNKHRTSFDPNRTEAQSSHHSSKPDTPHGTSVNNSDESCTKYINTKRSYQSMNREQDKTLRGQSKHIITMSKQPIYDVLIPHVSHIHHVKSSRRDSYLDMQDEFDRKKMEYELENGLSTPYPRARPPNLLPLYDSPPCTPSRKRQRTRKRRY